MVSIITREGKGAPITHAEMDTNLINIKAAIESGATGSSGASGRYAAMILAKKPVAYWQFNDKFGATQYLDSSGNGYHLTPVGSMMTARGGVVGEPGRGLYTLGGAGSGCATIPAALGTAWPASANFSIEALIRPLSQSQGGYSSVFCISTASSSTVGDIRLSLMRNGARTPYISVGTTANTSDGVAAYSTQEWASQDWLHIVSTSTGSLLSLYMNGDLVAQSTGVYNVPIIARPKGGVVCNPFTAAGGSTDAPPYCIIDEVALYNVALTADEVALHYRVAAGGSA
jgi:hypothetical protein